MDSTVSSNTWKFVFKKAVGTAALKLNTTAEESDVKMS